MHLLADVVLPWYDDKLDLEQLMSVVPRGSRKQSISARRMSECTNRLETTLKYGVLHRAMSLMVWFRVLKETCYKIWMKNN